MKIVALGRTRILLRAIKTLASSGHEVVGVVTGEPADFYRAKVSDFRQLADEIGAEFEFISDIAADRSINRLRSFGADVAVSVNWPTLIPPTVFECFEHGILNYHAGDLPRYRGNAAMNWAIITGESEVVHTVHEMTGELDAGPILAQRSSPITTETTIGDLYEDAERFAPEMFREVCDALATESLEREWQPADPAAALRCYPRRPIDSRLDWSDGAEHLDRIVRASSEPLFGAYTYLDGTLLRVWQAHSESPDFEWLGAPGQVAERRDSGDVAVCTGRGFLVLEEVQLKGEDRQSATAVVPSNRSRLGMDVRSELDRFQSRGNGSMAEGR